MADLEIDTGLSLDYLVAAINVLIEADLIEYDFDHEFVRIENWHFEVTRASGASNVQGYVRDFACVSIPNEQMAVRAIAEFAAGLLNTAHEQSEKAAEAEKIQEIASRIIRDTATA